MDTGSVSLNVYSANFETISTYLPVAPHSHHEGLWEQKQIIFKLWDILVYFKLICIALIIFYLINLLQKQNIRVIKQKNKSQENYSIVYNISIIHRVE